MSNLLMIVSGICFGIGAILITPEDVIKPSVLLLGGIWFMIFSIRVRMDEK